MLRRVARRGGSVPSGRSTRTARPVVESSTRVGSVGDLERGAAPRPCALRPAWRPIGPRLGEQRAARRAELLGDLVELVGDQRRGARRVGEQRLELGDLGAQLVALGLELDAAELGEAAQLQLEDVVGLQHAEVEDLDQPGARLRGVVAGADDLDDLVDVEDRDEQALDEVQPLLAAREAVARRGG